MSYTRAFSTLGCPELSLDAVGTLARRHGVKAIELRALGGTVDLPAYFAATYGTPAALAARRPQGEIAIVAVQSSLQLVGNTEAQRAAFLACVPWAEALDAPWLRVFDGGAPGDAANLAAMVDTLAWWKDVRRRHHWRPDVMIETHDSLFTGDAVAKLAAASQGVAILWDTHHTWKKGGEDPVATWRIIAPHVVHLHVKDSISRPSERHPFTYMHPGEGEFPMGPLRSVLTAEFRGTVSLEWEKLWHPYLPSLDDALTAAERNSWW